MNSKPSGNPLAMALAAGEPQAYAALYDRLSRRMLRVAAAMLGEPHHAEDAMHDVFVSLARSRFRFLQVDDLDAYVFASLRHAIGKRIAAAKRDRQHLHRLAQERADVLQTTPDVPDHFAALLASLPDEQREVVALKIDAELTFAQIAKVLDISPNTAAGRYRYAIKKLRERFKEFS